jgi:hypothetical protein
MQQQSDEKPEKTEIKEIPEDVVAALQGIVEWAHSFDPDDDRVLSEDIPLITAWLEGLGLLPPALWAMVHGPQIGEIGAVKD